MRINKAQEKLPRDIRKAEAEAVFLEPSLFGAKIYAPQHSGSDYSALDIILFVLTVALLPVWLSYTFVTTGETLAIVMVVGMIALIAMLTRPFIGLILFVGLLYIRPEEGFPALNGMHLALTTALITLVGMLGQKLLNRERAVVTPLNGIILSFGAIVVFSTVGGSTMGETVQDVLKLIALVLLTLNLVRTPGQYRALVSALLLFTTYLAMYSIFLYLQGGGVKDHDVMRSKATGIFGDPNDLAAAIDAGIALCLARVAASRALMRCLYLILAGAMMWAVLLTNSRGGLLALIVMVAACLLVLTRGKAGAALVAIILAVGMLKFGPSRMSQIDRSEESANSRLVFWANGVDHLMESPLTGVGYGNFPSINGGTTAHNSFVLCFTELGLPGFFCWMGCLYYCFQNVPFAKKRADSHFIAAEPTGNKLFAGMKSAAEGVAAGTFLPKPAREVPSQEPTLLERDADFYDRNGARLALVGFLAAAFWLSRTYVPNLYLLIAMCVAQQMSAHPEVTVWKRSREQRKQDWGRIALICISIIIGIGVIANRYK